MNKLNNIYKKNNHSSLTKFKDFICNEIKLFNGEFDDNLSNLHNFIKIEDINNLRISAFTKLNKDLDWKKLIFELIESEVTNLLGQDLLIQSKLNLSIQMPNDKTSLLPAHSDCWSADSPFQLNLWIPLTDAYSTNSMFIWSPEMTINLMNEVKKNNTKPLEIDNNQVMEEHFVDLKFGEILLFNPGIMHGNVQNKTNDTRVSLNVRIKSLFSPEPDERNPDRKVGTYYDIFKMSENTKFAIKLLETGILS